MNEYNETVNRIQKLFEAPLVVPDEFKFIDNLGGAFVLANKAKEEGTIVGQIFYRGSTIVCYEIRKTDFIYNIWVSGSITKAYLLYKEKDNGMVEKNVEQSTGISGLVRYLYINYYLKKYSFILSDSLHSEHGKKFWIKLTSELPPDKFKISVIENNTETNIQPQDVVKYFTTQLDRFSRIKISKI